MDRIQRSFKTWLAVLLVVIAAIYLAHGLFRAADPDEFQALVNAFDASRGLVPYAKYWDNHGPLMIWILRPVLSLWQGGHELIYCLRVAAWLNTMFIAGTVFWLVRRLHPMQLAAPWISVLFLLFAPPFLYKAIEIRADNPANLFSAVALAFIIIALQKGKPILFFLAGLCLGIIAGFTIKALIAAFALALFYTVWHLREKRLPRLADIGALAAGAIIPPAIIALVLADNGSLSAFTNFYFHSNITRHVSGFTSSEFVEIYAKAPVWALLATAIVCASLWRTVRGRAAGIEIGLLAMTIFYVAQFLLLLPTKNMQSLLPMYAPLALLVPYLFDGISKHNWLRNRNAALAAAVLLPLLLFRDMAYYNHLPNHGLPRQVAFANQALSRLTHQEYIFDPTGIVFLKPKPGPFHILVTFIRQMHQSGIIDLQIPALLKRNKIKAIVFDKRAKHLRTGDLVYITENYTPILGGPNSLLLALTPSETTGTTRSAPVPAAFKNWAANAFEAARQPTLPYNPPAWYRAAGY